LAGQRGAGTVFFGGCNLGCGYCQNRQISRREIALPELDAEALAERLLALAAQGCHNIAFVTPSHLVPQLLAALAHARAGGLDLPIVYNSGGYDAVEVLRALEGVVDVYLPDLKYASSATAAELSQASDYWPVATAAVREMLRQVGGLQCDSAGIAQRGVIVRHLVLPNDLAGSEDVLAFLASLEPRPAVSLMAQFYPIPACDHPLLQRRISAAELARAAARLAALGFEQGWVQELEPAELWRPDFRRPDPFAAQE